MFGKKKKPTNKKRVKPTAKPEAKKTTAKKPINAKKPAEKKVKTKKPANSLIKGKIYREKVNSQQGYEDWEFTGEKQKGPSGVNYYAMKNDRGVEWFSEQEINNMKCKTTKKSKTNAELAGELYDLMILKHPPEVRKRLPSREDFIKANTIPIKPIGDYKGRGPITRKELNDAILREKEMQGINSKPRTPRTSSAKSSNSKSKKK